jgi:hypothetical protein
MRRPVGVTASAIVAFLGSTLALVTAPLIVGAVFLEQPQASQAPPPPAAILILSGLMCVILGGLGIWTAVDLFRLKSWARTSILIFAGFLGASSLFTALMFMVVPMPPNVSGDTLRYFRATMLIGMAVPILIAVWWLVQFNTASTKAAFASVDAQPVSPRPISITIISLMMLIAGIWCFVPILTRTPGFLFGVALTGWAAAIVYTVFAVVSIYTGKGLLDLREPTRKMAIGWFAFWFIHAALVTLVPPLRQRMLKLPMTFVQDPKTPLPDPSMLINISLVFVAITTALSVWFLVRHRDAFVRTD